MWHPAEVARQRVSVWVDDGNLRVEYAQTLLAQDTVQYDRRQRRMRSIRSPILHPTAYASPQLELVELDETQWHNVSPRPDTRRTKKKAVACISSENPATGRGVWIGSFRPLPVRAAVRQRPQRVPRDHLRSDHPDQGWRQQLHPDSRAQRYTPISLTDGPGD